MQVGSSWSDIVLWLASEDCYQLDEAGMISAFGTRVRAAGVPLDRLVLHLRLLHPELMARTVTWAPGEAPTVYNRQHGIHVSPHFIGSPVWRAIQMRETTIAKADHPDDGHWAEFDIFEGRGLAELTVVPMRDAQGMQNAVSFATRQPSGFTAEQRGMLIHVVPALRNIAELHSLRLIERSLLDVYVGPMSAERVMGGSIRRGQVETLEAALFVCDLRDFTALSNRLPSSRVLDILNLYFDAVMPAIRDNGGEVLKIIGDAVLAFFHNDNAAAACAAALSAARGALEALSATDEADTPLSAGIALHYGAASYGNIGAGERLDFTVIGADVNLVSRIQTICSMTGRPILMSARFAEMLGDGGAHAIGEHALKGFPEPFILYAPDTGEPAGSTGTNSEG